MGRPIDSQAAIDAIERLDIPEDMCVSEILSHIELAIATLPSAQSEITLESAIDYLHSIGWMQEHDRALTESAQPERKRGKWIDGYCSVCGCDVPAYIEDWRWVKDMKARFCPMCGADMRGGVDGADGNG